MIRTLVPRPHVSALRFDKEAHRYTVLGIPRPSVTRIIAAAGMSPFGSSEPAITSPKMQIGKWMHTMLFLHFTGKLDEATLSPAMRLVLDQTKVWFTDNGLEPLVAEVPLVHSLYWYAGTPDLVARSLTVNEIVVIDWKWGVKKACDVIQLGGYVELVRNCYDLGNTNIIAISGHLKDILAGKHVKAMSGKDLANATGIFLAANACYRWRAAHGRLPQEEDPDEQLD